MKILKKAKQRNFLLDNNYYNELDIKYLLIHGDVQRLDFTENCENMFKNDFLDMNEEYIIFADDVKEVKVILDEYGYYRNCVVLKNGNMLHIKL